MVVLLEILWYTMQQIKLSVDVSIYCTDKIAGRSHCDSMSVVLGNEKFLERVFVMSTPCADSVKVF